MLIPFGVFSAAGASGGGGGGAAYELISTAYGTGSSSTISFTSIPSTYKHLQIRMTGRSTRATYPLDQVYIQFNGVTSSYTTHELRGSNSSVTSLSYGSTSGIYIGFIESAASTADIYDPVVADILDYSSTTKYKTVRSMGTRQSDYAPDGIYKTISLLSGLSQSTSAVSSIDIKVNTGNNWTSASRFSLYGIKG